MSLNIVVMVSGKSGRGSNMAAIVEACRSGQINGSVKLVVGNREESPALERARSLGLSTAVLNNSAPGKETGGEQRYAREALEMFQAVGADLICLAGYLLRIPSAILREYPGKVTNIHNALLPAFGGKGMYGMHVHSAAVDYGVKFSGCTVHFVEEAYDTGPIILQRVVPVHDDDTAETLAARVLVAEHEAYPAAISLISKGCVRLVGRKVSILQQ